MFTQGLLNQRAIVEIEPGIAIDHQKRLIPQQWQRLNDAAGRLQRTLLGRPVNGHAKRTAITQGLDQLVAEPGVVDHLLGDSGCFELFDMVDDERLAPDSQQRLGQQVSQRAHPLATASGQDHRLHGFTPALAIPGNTTCSSHWPKRANTG